MQLAVDPRRAGDQPVGGGAGDQLLDLAPPALGGDREPAVLDQAARIDQVREVLARRAPAGGVAALDRLRARLVAGQPAALEHLGEVVADAVLTHGGRLAYAWTSGTGRDQCDARRSRGGSAVRGRHDRGAGSGRGAGGRRRAARRRRHGARPRPRQRAHARGDDPVSRLRRRPAADGVAHEAHLAGREADGRRGRLLGRAARVRGDDPHGDDLLLGHVLARGGDRAGGRGRGRAGRGRLAADRRRRPGEVRARLRRRRPQPRPGRRGRRRARAAGLRPARDLLAVGALAALDRRARERARGPRADPPLRDRGRGQGLGRRARQAPRLLPRRDRDARAADGARARLLARPPTSSS